MKKKELEARIVKLEQRVKTLEWQMAMHPPKPDPRAPGPHWDTWPKITSNPNFPRFSSRY